MLLAQWTVHYIEKEVDKDMEVSFMTGLFDGKVTIITFYRIHGEVEVTEPAQDSSSQLSWSPAQGSPWHRADAGMPGQSRARDLLTQVQVDVNPVL